MPKLGIGSSLTRAGLTTPGIVTDSLVLKHNYAAGGVVPVSDGAASFNGSSDYIAIGAKPVDTADATYCFWANSSVSAANRAIFGHGTANKGEFSLAFDGSNNALLYLHGDLYQYWGIGNNASDGQWHHCAVVVDIDSMTDCKLYIDGVEITQGARATSATATAYGNLEIGRTSSSLEYEGYLCNFGIWTGLLSQAEIKSIMWKNYAGLSSDEKAYKGGLVSWWNMDEGTGTSVADSHGSNDGTFT
jgi:hypothetical protein